MSETIEQQQLADTNGQPVLAELGGITIQILSNGQPLGLALVTDSSGRAVSSAVPRGEPVVVREVAPSTGFQQSADMPVTLTSESQLVTVTNHETPARAHDRATTANREREPAKC